MKKKLKLKKETLRALVQNVSGGERDWIDPDIGLSYKPGCRPEKQSAGLDCDQSQWFSFCPGCIIW